MDFISRQKELLLKLKRYLLTRLATTDSEVNKVGCLDRSRAMPLLAWPKPRSLTMTLAPTASSSPFRPDALAGKVAVVTGGGR